MSKERLTYETELGISLDTKEDCSTMSACWNCDIPPRKCKYFEDAIEKLAEYEELEEQGLLLRLPCKVGDMVYYILGIPKVACCIEETPFELSDIARIGEDLFLTRSEAEKKLRGLG